MDTGIHMAIGNQTYSCLYCHDTGWEIRKVSSAEVYGPDKADWPDVDMAYPCRRCKGRVIVPDEYGQDMSRAAETADTFWKNYSAWSMEGMGLYVWSKTRGTGKTFLACCLGRSVREKYHVTVKFITSVDYLAAVTESYREENRGRDSSQIYRECELLILDDLGAESRSQKNNWTDKEFFRLLGGRYSQGKATIITSNVPLTELNVDERVSSRINAKSIILKLPDVSIRQRQAENKKRAFLNRLTKI